MKKELIREIKFNEDITQALFLNNEGDIVAAHGGQLSIIYARDYQPLEQPLPDDESILGNITKRIIYIEFFLEKRELADDSIMRELKSQEDLIKNQVLRFASTKSSSPIKAEVVVKDNHITGRHLTDDKVSKIFDE